MTKDIGKLPNTVPTLFEFILNKWCKDYGHEFIRCLVSLITLSRD